MLCKAERFNHSRLCLKSACTSHALRVGNAVWNVDILSYTFLVTAVQATLLLIIH